MSAAGVQLLKIESAGNAAEKALLRSLKANNVAATATGLLRLFQVRCYPAAPGQTALSERDAQWV
jgi:hypothetical protein